MSLPTVASECGTDENERLAQIAFKVPASVRDRFRRECEREGERQSTVLRRLVLGFLGALLLTGCYTSLPIFAPSLQPGDLEIIDEAAGMLGMPWERRRRARGAVLVLLVDNLDDQQRGFADTPRPHEVKCHRYAISERDPFVLAHELGHTLTLQHRDDPDAIMHPQVSGDEFSDDEFDRMDRSARALAICNPFER
jgi:hypothetical protein